MVGFLKKREKTLFFFLLLMRKTFKRFRELNRFFCVQIGKDITLTRIYVALMRRFIFQTSVLYWNFLFLPEY